MPIVTISREYGSGGMHIGPLVAERLGADFVDSTLIAEVSRRLRISEDAVRQWDERRESLILRLLRAMRAAHPEYAAGIPIADDGIASSPDPERVGAEIRDVILEEARSGNAVIMGRGAVFILAGAGDAMHFRLVAERRDRIRRIREAGGCSEEEAEHRIDQTDRERESYIRHFFDQDIRDPLHYHMVLNTSALGYAETARIIAEIALGRAPRDDSPR